jgi:hypothetical protein
MKLARSKEEKLKKLPEFKKKPFKTKPMMKTLSKLIDRNKTRSIPNYNKSLMTLNSKEPRKLPEKEIWKMKPLESRSKPKNSKRKGNA